MADNFSKWQGGPNFIKARQWGVGRTNSGEGAKKFGSAAMKRGNTFKFNPNPTRCSHPGCMIAQQAKIDRENYALSKRVV